MSAAGSTALQRALRVAGVVLLALLLAALAALLWYRQASLPTVLPNIGRFARGNLGFLSPA
jgi:hypothetical protein